jgi:hypothetical protein
VELAIVGTHVELNPHEKVFAAGGGGAVQAFWQLCDELYGPAVLACAHCPLVVLHVHL